MSRPVTSMLFDTPLPVKVRMHLPPASEKLAISAIANSIGAEPEVSKPASKTTTSALPRAWVGVGEGEADSEGKSLGVAEVDGAAESLGVTSVPQFG